MTDVRVDQLLDIGDTQKPDALVMLQQDGVSFKGPTRPNPPREINVTSQAQLEAQFGTDLEIPDGESMHFSIAPEGISELERGDVEDADITITANEDIFRGIINKEIKPLKAYIKKQIKLKAKEFQDILFIKKLF